MYRDNVHQITISFFVSINTIRRIKMLLSDMRLTSNFKHWLYGSENSVILRCYGWHTDKIGDYRMCFWRLEIRWGNRPRVSNRCRDAGAKNPECQISHINQILTPESFNRPFAQISQCELLIKLRWATTREVSCHRQLTIDLPLVLWAPGKLPASYVLTGNLP